MRAASLLVVLVLAKILMLWGHAIEISAWTPAAYFSDDVLVAAVAAAFEALAARSRIGWVVYGLAILYVAINVPVARVLGSPLTAPMIRAARGPLADSISQYLTAANVASVVLVIAAGVVMPIVLARRKSSRGARHSGHRAAGLSAAAVFVALGTAASAHLDTAGLDRNAFTSLVPLSLPRVAASAPAGDWRESPFPSRDSSDLSRYRGAAKDFNVIVVALESTAARYLRLYGAREDPTPTLTALGRDALVFENVYATYPESIKGLFATLCSRYPAFNEPAETHAAAPCASLAEALRAAGYRTGLFHSGRFAYLGMDALIQRKGFDALEDAGAIGGNIHSSFGVDEPATVQRMLGWIDSLGADQRFFLTYLPVAGHHPYASPEAGPFARETDLGRYRNALHYGDESLAALLAGLRARHLDSRTLVLVYGDHGEAFGQHPGNIGHTMFIDDENVKVPLLIAIPGASTAGERVPSVASLLDTAPTILDLIGLAPRREYQGTSLLQPGPRMALFFTDYALGWLGLRDGCWKYQLQVDSGRSALYDVCRDPDETRSVAAMSPDRVRAYRSRVLQWSASQKALIASREDVALLREMRPKGH